MTKAQKGTTKKGRKTAPRTTAAKSAFLKSFSETGNIGLAAEHAGVARRTHYKWIASDPEYVEAFEEALEEAIDVLEAEARRRAVEGVEEPTGWYKGQPGGYIRKYSDVLLMFLLNARRPDIYKRHVKHEHSGPVGGPIKTESTVDLTVLRDETLEMMREDLKKAEEV